VATPRILTPLTPSPFPRASLLFILVCFCQSIERQRRTGHEANQNLLLRILGFLLGSTLAGAGVYYYILEEYKVSNGVLTEDIWKLQAAVQRIHTYVQTLEEKLAELERKQK
jgi:cell division protein FtsB